GHMTLTTQGYFDKEEEMPLSNGVSHADAITKQLIGLSEVRGVQPRVEFSGLISNGSKSSIFIGIGVNEREVDMKGPCLDVRDGQTLSNI
ncbi:ABC transporter permease, partial [Escherichia coli]|nr:ABC transporter permease [Escherichia coli]